MANRVLRDWTTSEAVDNLTSGAEVFFTRLIMKADDYGSYHSNPKLIKAALFPLKETSIREIEGWLNECIKAGLVFTYESGGRKYIRIDNFGQRLRNMRNTFPQPDVNPLTSRGNSRPETETKRNETESETETKPHEFDDTFLKAFDDQTCESYKLAFRGMDLGAELQKFRIKCDNDKSKYYGRDVGGLRTAFQYQLQNIRNNGKRKSGTIKDGEDEIREILSREFGAKGTAG